ncbi:unnamed protein product [Lactuca virosa]|uniref:ATPase F1/V1/A1 complex alpha/beta subunit N-terminal domain-containing protein n=1 Tax=Lactuca virosa TaxID=75947 RepID=A0AAU9MI21_9ASTR|nr:unnamed protein product [Lactuca virosa]
MESELVEFEEGTIGIALNLESTNVGVVLMGDGLLIQEGSYVKETGRIAQIPVSEAYLGRVINALAKPIDEKNTPPFCSILLLCLSSLKGKIAKPLPSIVLFYHLALYALHHRRISSLCILMSRIHWRYESRAYAYSC